MREQAGLGMPCSIARACRHTGRNIMNTQRQDGGTDSAAMLDPRWLLSLVQDKQCAGDGEPAGADAVEKTPATVTDAHRHY